MAETVVVTGGSGFVASWCIAELLRRGYAVRATLRGLTKEPAVRSALAASGAPVERLSFHAADLTRDDGWNVVMAGADYVLHVASPLSGGKEDAAALIEAARDGTVRVLGAAVRAKVKRVVMTSSTAACTPPSTDTVGDETVWSDPAAPHVNAYRRSKVLAEKAAWALMETKGGQTQFTTVLPGAVFGPLLLPESQGSAQILQRMLDGRPPGIPRLGFCVVDVRDLADLHLRAMTAPEAAGERFVGAGEFLWMTEIAAALKERLGARAAKVPSRRLPDFLVRFLAVFLPPLRMLTPMLGRKQLFSAEKARRVLGFTSRPARETIVECAQSLGEG